MLKNLKKEDFIKGLKELVEHLEVNKEVDLENFNNEVLKFAYSNKKPFEEVVKECVLKEMKTYIDDCELDKKCNIYSVVSDYFMPDNKYGYFPSLDENLALLEQIHYEDSYLADEIVAKVKEQIRYNDESPKSKLNSMVDYNYTEAGYYMEFAMQKVLEKEIISAKELIQEIDGMEDYEIDEDLSRGDYKALYNSLAKKEVYSLEEIKQDLLFEKELENNFYEEKNKDLDEENLKGLKNEIKDFQQKILFMLKEEKLEKISDEEYKFKDDILESQDGEFSSFCDKICIASEFPFEKYLTSEQMIKRYDLEDYLAPFQILNENEDILFDSEEKNVSENLKGFIITVKGQEFWDNMDISKVSEWENLNLDIVFEDGGKKHTYIDFDEYVRGTDYLYNKLISKMESEVDFYANEVKNDLLKYKTDGIIKTEVLEILEKKYDKETNEDTKEIEQEIDNKNEIEKDF